MTPRLRRFLHLERARPARPDPPGGPAGVEERFDAVLRGVEARASAGGAEERGDRGGVPLLRWLRRRWW